MARTATVPVSRKQDCSGVCVLANITGGGYIYVRRGIFMYYFLFPSGTEVAVEYPSDEAAIREGCRALTEAARDTNYTPRDFKVEILNSDRLPLVHASLKLEIQRGKGD
jgi:hypothetical protein